LSGTLYVVATPIGNLEDITLRALRVLREDVTLIACEDTRQTAKLLEHYEIRKPLISYHEHNEASRTTEILNRLLDGESVALVSDSGTPLVSDPGYRIVNAAAEKGLKVTPIPGPSAAITALVGSGLPTNDFRFVGFLPPKIGARRRLLQALASEITALVIYESPHRILDTLRDIHEILGARRMALGRELTKIHEEFLRGTVLEILDQLQQRSAMKGEFTLVIGGRDEGAETGDPVTEVALLKAEGIDQMEAIKRVAKRLGLPKREVYRLVTAEGNILPDIRHDSRQTRR